MEREPTSPRKVGVIERDNQLAETLQLALEVDGYHVVQLAHRADLNEQSFGRFIRRHRPPLVLFDIPYPYEDNWELYQQLTHTKGNSRRKFIPMGAFTPQFEEMLQEMGQVFIPKPFDLDYFLNTVDQHYPRRQARQRNVQEPVTHHLLIGSTEKVATPYLAPLTVRK